jgi:chemotaxis protein CheD
MPKIEIKKSSDYYQCIVSPGFIVVTQEPALICTVCGNGVVVTVWDKAKRSGGMAHCIYPRADKRKVTNYSADIAVAQMLKKIFDLNGRAADLDAQIIGGGSAGNMARGRAHKTVSVAKKVLRRHGIAVVSEDVGGSMGRKIIFDTQSGDIMVLKTRNVRSSDWIPESMIQNKDAQGTREKRKE